MIEDKEDVRIVEREREREGGGERKRQRYPLFTHTQNLPYILAKNLYYLTDHGIMISDITIQS